MPEFRILIPSVLKFKRDASSNNNRSLSQRGLAEYIRVGYFEWWFTEFVDGHAIICDVGSCVCFNSDSTSLLAGWLIYIHDGARRWLPPLFRPVAVGIGISRCVSIAHCASTLGNVVLNVNYNHGQDRQSETSVLSLSDCEYIPSILLTTVTSKGKV